MCVYIYISLVQANGAVSSPTSSRQAGLHPGHGKLSKKSIRVVPIDGGLMEV